MRKAKQCRKCHKYYPESKLYEVKPKKMFIESLIGSESDEKEFLCEGCINA